ncbi:MAG: SIMPL domain-containing protein [Candidatus Bathyarchaeia archaeon]|jgi:hypothetical protein
MSEIASRRLFYLAAIAMVAIVLISAIALIKPTTTLQTPGQNANPKTIQVTGTAIVNAAPDKAILVLAVQTQAASATQAAADNAATMTNVLAALSNLGIDKSSIETAFYTLSPVYDQTTPSKLIGYSVRNAIQVTLKDFSLVGKALDAAVTAGVNEVQGITFTLSDTALATLQKQALGQALQDANAQARAAASNLGVSIVGPISVSPGYVFQPTYRTYSAAAEPTPIQPGTLQVTVTVQVTYQFA